MTAKEAMNIVIDGKYTTEELKKKLSHLLFKKINLLKN